MRNSPRLLTPLRPLASPFQPPCPWAGDPVRADQGGSSPPRTGHRPPPPAPAIPAPLQRRWEPPPAGPVSTLHSEAHAPGRPPAPQVYTSKVSDSVRLLWPLSAVLGCTKGAAARGWGRGLPSWGGTKAAALSGVGGARGQARGAELGPLRCPPDAATRQLPAAQGCPHLARWDPTTQRLEGYPNSSPRPLGSWGACSLHAGAGACPCGQSDPVAVKPLVFVFVRFQYCRAPDE